MRETPNNADSDHIQRAFDRAEQVTEAEFPAIPRIGETISVENDSAALEKVTDVNYQISDNCAAVRVLLEPKSNYSYDAI